MCIINSATKYIIENNELKKIIINKDRILKNYSSSRKECKTKCKKRTNKQQKKQSNRTRGNKERNNKLTNKPY